MADEDMEVMQQQFTTALDSLTRHNVDLQAELQEQRHTAAGKARRVLGCPRRVARLLCSVPGLRWRRGATTVEADVGSRESRNADSKRPDPRGRRSGSISTALLDDVHDLQGSSSEHRVLGR